MIIKKHESYQFEETTSKDDEPAKRVSAERTVHEIRDTEKGTFDTDCDTKFSNGLDLSPFNPSIEARPPLQPHRTPTQPPNQVDLPFEEKEMDFDQLIQQSTGKKYSSSWFYGDSSKNPYPTIEEQVKLCRKIASQLVDDENRKSKGASMFFKRLKRSQKWIHEGNCTNDAGSYTDLRSGSSSSSSQSDATNGSFQLAEEQVQRMKKELKSETIPRLKLILDPRQVLSLEKLRKMGEIVEHNLVSPDMCHNLVKDLNSPEANKGAQIFLRRKEKSQEWVVDENSCSAQLREKKREKELKVMQEENAQREWLARKQREKMAELEQLENIKKSLPKIKLVKSPWEASLGGSVDQAFQVLAPKDKQLQPVERPTKLQSVRSNQRKTFKDFNRNPRGWGVPDDEYDQSWKTSFETCHDSPIPPLSSHLNHHPQCHRSPQPSPQFSPPPPPPSSSRPAPPPRTSSGLSPGYVLPEFELPRSYTLMEQLRLSKPKCAEFGLLPQVMAVQKRPQSILKNPQKCHLHRSATVNFKLDDQLPAKHFDLKSLHSGANPPSKLARFQNFNSVPKKWSNQPIAYL